jgi:hypothetical protein
LKADEDLKRRFSLITAQSIQSLYHDEPKRAFRHIIADAQPELNIKLSDIHGFFKSRWSQKVEISEADSPNIWDLQKRIPEDVQNEWMKMLTDKDGIRRTILTRGNRAAPGLDKITNPSFKLTINESVEFFCIVDRNFIKIWKTSINMESIKSYSSFQKR